MKKIVITGLGMVTPVGNGKDATWSSLKAGKCGIGRKLYETLEEQLAQQGIKNLYACIGSPIEEDEYLTNNSEQFHAHLGFVKVGEFHKCGFKFGRWYNMIWMEKIIGEHR